MVDGVQRNRKPALLRPLLLASVLAACAPAPSNDLAAHAPSRAPSVAEDWGDARDEFARDPAYARSQALCRRVRGRTPPAADRPDARMARALRGCRSEDLYYGIDGDSGRGARRDPVRARLCAFLEQDAAQARPNSEPGWPYSGRGMLATLYANGEGAARDIAVATHLACGMAGGPREMDRWVSALQARRPGQRDFDFCDDAIEMTMSGACYVHTVLVAGARDDDALLAASRAWGAGARRKFARARQAFEAFAALHSQYEIHISGTLTFPQITAMLERRAAFRAMIRQLSSGAAPRATRRQLRVAAARLDAAYAAARRNPWNARPEDRRAAQRAWLRYRNAFLDFAAVRFPDVPRAGLDGWLMRERIGMLRDAPTSDG